MKLALPKELGPCHEALVATPASSDEALRTPFRSMLNATKSIWPSSPSLYFVKSRLMGMGRFAARANPEPSRVAGAAHDRPTLPRAQ
jgi:hypothetical protein